MKVTRTHSHYQGRGSMIESTTETSSLCLGSRHEEMACRTSLARLRPKALHQHVAPTPRSGLLKPPAPPSLSLGEVLGSGSSGPFWATLVPQGCSIDNRIFSSASSTKSTSAAKVPVRQGTQSRCKVHSESIVLSQTRPQKETGENT